MLSCLENVIGLADTSCECWDDTKPVDFATLNASSSGLYIAQNDTIPVNWAASGADCSTGSIWDMLLHSRTKAIRLFLSDYLAEIQATKQQRFAPFTKIGDDYYRSANVVKNDFLGAYIEPYCIKGGKIVVNSIDIAFFSGVTGSTDVDIFIYSSLDLTTPLDTVTATVTANKQYFTATLTTPLEIDLGEIRTDLNERIYFVYQLPTGFVPVNNKTEKGCGCNKGSKYRDNPFLAVTKVAGMQSDSIANLGTSNYVTGDMNGLVINANWQCDYYSWLCELSQDPTTATGGSRLLLGMGLADTLQAKAIMILIDSILTSGRINYYTMVLDADILYAKYKHYESIYNKGIANLAFYIPADVTDCLICRDDKRIKQSNILT